MEFVTWAALGVGGAAMVGIATTGFFLGQLSGKVNNGLTKDLQEIKADVKTGFSSVWKRLDELPCRTPRCPTEAMKEND